MSINADAANTDKNVPDINTYGLSDLGYKIFLDRYALKDLDRSSLQVGDTVVAVLNDSRDMNGKREVSVITALNDDDTAVIITQSGDELTLRTEYLDKPLEINPTQLHKRVARGVASVETEDKQEEWAQKFEWLMDDWKFIPGGRILTMAGSGHNLSAFNCFVIAMPKDSRAGIIDTLEEMSEIMSRGGGVGINVSSLRPKNSYVKGVNGRSSGAVSFGALYSFMTGLISQAGSRRGALMLILNDYHPDILSFIDSKKTAGNITNANISVGISDRFMDAVNADADWDLIFPDTSYAGYDEEWDGNIEKWQESGKPIVIYRTVKAREMWMKIIESAWGSAEPGLWFRDRANKMSNSYYYDNGHLICTNPCVTGDTLVNTSLGIKTMEELYRTQAEFSVVTDGRFGTDTLQQSSKVFATGVKPVYKLTTSDGYVLKATSNHQIMTSSGWKELGQIQSGDMIHTLNRIGAFGSEGDLKLGRTIGWLVGDGHFSSGRAFLSFYHEKAALAPMFAEYVNEIAGDEETLGNRKEYTVGAVATPTHDRTVVGSVRLQRILERYGLLEKKLQVPEVVFNGTEEMQRGYLQGLFSADGSIQGNLKTGLSIRLTSTSLELLSQVQILLGNFGIKGKIYKFRKMAETKAMPDGQGGLKDYETQAVHELIISNINIQNFKEDIGFLQEYQTAKLDNLINSRSLKFRRELFVSKVESITYIGNEMVYDLQQPTTHSFVANNIVVHNCGEQSLAANAVCNLGAINLGKFALNETLPLAEVPYKTAIASVDWTSLAQATNYAIRFLDDVIDHTYYVTDANKDQEQSERRVGLGIMGLAELMVRIGIRYGSEDSIRFIEEIMHHIARESYIASALNAEEKGSFEWFDADKFINSGFMLNMDEDVRQLVYEKGIRNVTLNTIAPTGTTSTMVDTSGGIEPYFSFVFYRQGRLGVHEQRVALAEQWFQTYWPSGKSAKDATTNERGRIFFDNLPMNDAGEVTLPSFFVTAMDLPPEEHVRTMAAAQKWVDSSISKTCNVPNNYTLEQTEQLYMQMYDLGCKGGTIYRDGSRDEQVLHLENPEEKKTEKPVVQPELVTATYETAQDFSTRNKRRPSLLNGVTFQVATPYATNAYVTVNEDENRYPYEVFITVGKAGSDLQAQAESIGRLISKSIQIMPPYLRFDGLREIVLQLVGIGGNRSTGFGPNQVRSLPDAIGSSIMKMYIDKRDIKTQIEEQISNIASFQMLDVSNTVTTANVVTTVYAVAETSANGHTNNGKNAYNDNTRPAIKSMDKASAMTEMCPDCQNFSLIREEGCKHCHNCGYSEC